MTYPGDTVSLLLDLSSHSVINTTPLISIIHSLDDGLQILAGPNTVAIPMTSISGIATLFKYLWPTVGVASGTYLAVASYIADGVTYSNVLFQKIELGDSRITGVVALDSTVAKDATVSHESIVMHKADFIAPKDDVSIQSILGRLNNLPLGVADEATLLSVVSLLTDLSDATFGSQTIDKLASLLTMYRQNGNILQQFSLSETGQYSSRSRGIVANIAVPPPGYTPTPGWFDPTVSSNNSVTINLANGLSQEITLGPAGVLVNPLIGTLASGAHLFLKVRQDSIGGHQVTFDSSWPFVYGSVPPVSQAPDTYTTFIFSTNANTGQLEIDSIYSPY